MAIIQKIYYVFIIAGLSLSGFNFTPAAAQTAVGPEPEIRFSGRNDLSPAADQSWQSE